MVKDSAETAIPRSTPVAGMTAGRRSNGVTRLDGGSIRQPARGVNDRRRLARSLEAMEAAHLSAYGGGA